MLRLPKSRTFIWKRTLTNTATRAVVYESNGNPASVLSVVTYPPPPKPTGSSITVKHLLSPVNPSDINVVEGVYPSQPRARQLNVNGQDRTLRIPGNEGLGEVTGVGEGVKGLKMGDWVVFSKRQSGTWSSGQVLEEEDVIKVDRGAGISAVNAATLMVRSSRNITLLFWTLIDTWTMCVGEPSNGIQHAIRIRGPATGGLGHSEWRKQCGAVIHGPRGPYGLNRYRWDKL